MTKNELIKDAQRMEDAACDLLMERHYKTRTVLYWLCVAVLHIIECEVKRYDNRTRN